MIAPVSADLEGALVAWLRGIGVAQRVVTELPGNLQDAAVLPLVEVTDIGGPSVAVGLDAATVDVDCYQVGRQPARAFANTVRDALQYRLPGVTFAAGGMVTHVRVLLRPAWRPYDNTAVRRVGATYQIHFRQPSS